MPSDLTFGPPLSGDEMRAYASATNYAFADAPTAEPDISWWERDTTSLVRVARRGGTVVGGATIHPETQWFGGRPVPSALIGAVAILPEHRSGGVGSGLVADYLRFSRKQDLAISSLYPASHPVYYRGGYEVAGEKLHYDIPTGILQATRRFAENVTIRPDPGDDETIKDLYRRWARTLPGHVGRETWGWPRKLGVDSQAVHRYLAVRDGQPTGYLIYIQNVSPRDHERRIVIRDWVPLDRATNRAFLGFLGGHSGTIAGVLFAGGPYDHRLLDLPNAGIRVISPDPWMVRIVDLPAALTARGYPARLTAELHLEFGDDLLPENAGRWRVRIAGGEATVEPGGEGRIRLNSRGLAPIYTGAQPAERVAHPDLLSGSAEDLATMTEVFAGPPPWMSDAF